MRFRRLLVALALLLALAWVAPAVVIGFGLPRLARAQRIDLSLEGTRPAFPWGVSVARVGVRREASVYELLNVSLVPTFAGPRLAGDLGGGRATLRGLGWRFDGATAQLEGVEAEVLRLLPMGELRGKASGIIRIGERNEVELSLADGALGGLPGLAFELPFERLIVSLARAEDQAWEVRWLDVLGPTLSASAMGRVSAARELDLRIDVRSLDESLRPVLDALRVPPEPAPFSFTLVGPIFGLRAEALPPRSN